MNLILLTAEDFADQNVDGGIAHLGGHRARHIREVLKATPGDTLRCGLLGGQTGTAEVCEIASRTTLRVDLNTAPPAKLPLTLLLALPRPKAARRIIRSATELGVAEIILLNSYRVEKSYWQSPLVDEQHLNNAMLEGLEQCGDTILPSLRRATRFKPFVEDELPGILADKTGFLAHPYAECPAPQHCREPSLLAIGPEGGFIPYEVEKFKDAGMQAFQIGPRILKTETAVPALIARLFY